MLTKLCNFIKIEHTIFSLPLIFAGGYLGAGRQLPRLDTLALIILAGVGARTFGMAMNRILDRKIDADNPRTNNRELPAGKLTLVHAIGVALLGLILYVTACFLLGPFILMLSIIPGIILFSYSLLKRFTWLCHYGIGLALGMSPVGAYVAVKQSLLFTPDILLLGAFTFFWMSGYDIIYAMQDRVFDKQHKIYSLPSRFNNRIAQYVAGITHLMAFISMYALTILLVPNIWSGIILLGCGGAFIYSYLPSVPLPARFFPASAVTGILGAMLVLL